MPLLIFHCRTRLFSVLIRQRTILGGARTKILPSPLREQLMIFTLFPTELAVLLSCLLKYIGMSRLFLQSNFVIKMLTIEI